MKPITTRRSRSALDQRMDAVLFFSGVRPLLSLYDAFFGILSYFIKPKAIICDDPRNAKLCKPDRRFWKYPEFVPYWDVVAATARSYSEDVFIYRGSVHDPLFKAIFQEELRPKVCLMAGFGQKIPPEIFAFESVELFVNSHATLPRDPKRPFHPDWPSAITGGAEPWENIFCENVGKATIVGYQIDEGLDTGTEVYGWSDYFDYPVVENPLNEEDLGERVLMMHKTAGPYTVQLFRNILQTMTGDWFVPNTSLEAPNRLRWDCCHRNVGRTHVEPGSSITTFTCD